MINIAIDGPSGAGKSTIAKALAEELNILYLDTGAMYRAVAYKALAFGIDPNERKEVLNMLGSTCVDIRYKDGQQCVYLDDTDISDKIREHRISKAASDISKIPEVRKKLVEMQRKIAKENDVVLDGRDTTSYVLPDANFKFYLTADKEERARRRWHDLQKKGSDLSFEQVLADIIDRDYNDMNRDFAPLIKTDDSVLIDSTRMFPEDVVRTILSYMGKEK